MIIKLVYFFISALFLSGTSNAITVQKPELLLHNSDTLYIHVEYREDSPLSNLFLSKKYHEKLEAQIDTTCWSSGCVRAYAPIWKIQDNELYLHRLQHCCSEKEVSLNQIFKRKNITEEGVKAFWVDEKISVSDKFAELYYFFFDFEEYEKVKWYQIKVKKGTVQSIKEERRN